MPTYSVPGVYVEEIGSGPTPLRPSETAIAAFVGFTETRPPGAAGNAATLVTSWQEYQERFGGFDQAGDLVALLPIAVKGYFDEGGTKAYIVPIAHRHEPTGPTSGAVLEAVERSAVHGDESTGTGIAGLTACRDVTMLICPDLHNIATTWSVDDGTATPEAFDESIWNEIQQAMLAHCDSMGNRMAILDTPKDRIEPQDVLDWRTIDARYSSARGALYYPWITIIDPLGTGGLIDVPPSGHVAGVWARNDSTRGVHEAPANETINTAQGVATMITSEQQERLNPDGINAIRSFGARGVKIWGARTLSGDPTWQYINVRRLFNMIEQTLLEQMQWVAFEPNDMALWERATRVIQGFLDGLWREGAFVGQSAEEAFFVRCDDQLNPLSNQETGVLIAEVAIAPISPAEFVVVRLSFKTQPASSPAT